MVTGARLAVAIRTAAACAVLLGGMVAGCAPAGRPATEWAGSVCAALGPWRAQIADLNAQAQSAMAGGQLAGADPRQPCRPA